MYQAYTFIFRPYIRCTAFQYYYYYIINTLLLSDYVTLVFFNEVIKSTIRPYDHGKKTYFRTNREKTCFIGFAHSK